MSDLISRQTAIYFFLDKGMITAAIYVERMPSAQPKTCEYWDDESNFCVLNKPSAQPEIIRCHDCKHSAHWYSDKWRCFLWNEYSIDVFEDGFCNYAERRTDNGKD